MPEPRVEFTGSPGEGDVFKLKQIEAQLRRMTMVFMEGADPIVIFDLEGHVVDLNRESERVFGWTRADVLGKPSKQFLPPDWQSQADQNLKRLQQGETLRNSETVVQAKSGKGIPVLSTLFPLTDEHDRPIAFASILKDISQLKQAVANLERRNRELKQFANALAHDLGAPLRAIRSFSQLLEKNCSAQLDAEGRESIQFIVGGVERMDRMIVDLLQYALVGSQTKSFAPVDGSQILEQAVANLRATIAESGAEVSSDPLPTVVGQASQLVQLFQNLIGNAIKYNREPPPRVHISVERTAEGWQFSVRDNGIGLDSAHFEKIFEAFHRLHSQDEFPGTGIGLATCKAIVERHGGRIWVESEPGRGSAFYFTLDAK